MKLLNVASQPFNKQFTSAFFWNLFDAVTSQALLIIFHFTIRNITSIELHAQLGCSLSIFYLALTVLNLGLDQAMAPFLNSFTENKNNFNNFLKYLFIPQIIFLILASGALFFVWQYIPVCSKLITCDNNLIFIICATIVIESIRKTIRYLLQLLFITNVTALTEVIGTACYVIITVTLSYFGVFTSLKFFWIALNFFAIAQTLVLVYFLNSFYQKLGQQEISSNKNIYLRIYKTRFFIWLNQLTNQIFSGNFLVPLCAIQFGLDQASFAKIVTSVARWITLVSQKIFGISSYALLAHTKDLTQQIKHTVFENLSYLLNQILYCLIIFLLINGQKIVHLQSSYNLLNWSSIYLMFIISISESFFILYERWYNIEEKANYYLYFNLLSFLGFYLFLPKLNTPFLFFGAIIVFRILTFIILSIFSFYRWKIWPNLKPNFLVLLIAFIFAIIFYLFI